MRSFYEHLKSMALPSQGNFDGVFRSSAIFPVIETPTIHSRLLFMGYWFLKRNIQEIGCQVTSRSKSGEKIMRSYFKIDQPKAYRMELKDFLPPETENFEGSLEIEFFSTQNLVFPYPAVVVNYYGPHFSTVVHSAQRVYNNFEDLKKNSVSKVKEAGFNIYQSDNLTSFFTIINGPQALKNRSIEMEIFNSKQEVLKKTIPLAEIAPYQTLFIYPNEHVDLDKFLGGRVGTCRLQFDVDWIFPRVLAGNRQNDPSAITITHTYYDCSEQASPSDYWRPDEQGWLPATLMIPVERADEFFTNVYFYPIYSPSRFFIDAEIYDELGQKVAEKKELLEIHKHSSFAPVPVSDLIKNLPALKRFGCRLIARTAEGEKLPARIKLGLDTGTLRASSTPSNICTNLQPFNPDLLNKKSSFKWLPLLADRAHSSIWLMNSSPLADHHLSAEVTIRFYREQDSTFLERNLLILPQGFVTFDTEADSELLEFFGGKIGWATIITSNPYLTTYYLTYDAQGVVGGDHGF